MLKAFSNNPDGLLSSINDGIDDGTIDTWEKSQSGSFTHSTKSGQWKNRAWFRGKVLDDSVVFNIIRPKGTQVTKEVYAVYHGRFSEMLLAHFDQQITAIRLTALAGDGDLV